MIHFEMSRPSLWTEGLQILIRLLKDKYPNVAVVFVNMPSVKDFTVFSEPLREVFFHQVSYLRKCLMEIVETQENVFFLDKIIRLHEWIDKQNLDFNPEDFYSDGVHPSALTFSYWGKDIAEFIHENIIKTKDIS